MLRIEKQKKEEILGNLKNVIGILSKMHINRFKGHTSIRLKIIHLDQQKEKTYQNGFLYMLFCVFHLIFSSTCIRSCVCVDANPLFTE